MPAYDYHCDANGRTVEVTHPIDVTLRFWGEVCYVAQIPLGDTDPLAAVHRVITGAPAVHVSAGNAQLKNAGFTKLVRRDQGVWENVTATDGEARYMRAGDADTLPHIHRKVRD
ncbi:MAG: zinc ribbon domain-containing protein [Chromatiales bacterium]|nr:zinc ribbon domain-containing protein [Chromatiales bacterium]